MNADSLIASFATGTYAVTRRPLATLLAGRAVAGTAETLLIVATVVPATGRDLQRLPEGRQDRETWAVFTATLLYCADSSHEADLITLDGVAWEVQHVESWPGFYRALAQRP